MFAWCARGVRRAYGPGGGRAGAGMCMLPGVLCTTYLLLCIIYDYDYDYDHYDDRDVADDDNMIIAVVSEVVIIQ